MRLLFTLSGAGEFRKGLREGRPLHNRRSRGGRAVHNRHSGEGRNPGVGLLSYEIDAHPPHLFPGTNSRLTTYT